MGTELLELPNASETNLVLQVGKHDTQCLSSLESQQCPACSCSGPAGQLLSIRYRTCRSPGSQLDMSSLPHSLFLPDLHTKVSKILLHLFLSPRDWLETIAMYSGVM